LVLSLSTRQKTSELNELILKLFQQQEAFLAWIKLYDIESRCKFTEELELGMESQSTGSPVYYASFLGLSQVLHELIESEEEKTKQSSESCTLNLVNSKGGKFGNPLQAASYRGHKSVVLQLLERGANVNTQYGRLGNALQAASYKGHVSVVQQLLEKGANVNAQGGQYGSALHAASYRGYATVVQQLLERGANVNARNGDHGNALQVSSYEGHESVVYQLLKKGADVNAQGGY
jgi:ankyrin repeat protein